jgi:hypothetical protein
MNEHDTANHTAATRLNRIRWISQLFQGLCIFVLGLLFVYALHVLFAPLATGTELSGLESNASQITPGQSGNIDQNSPKQGITLVTNSVRICAFGLGQPVFRLDRGSLRSPWLIRFIYMIQELCLSVGLVILYRLFGLYKTGAIFTAANVYCFKLIGCWLLGLWALAHLFELSKLVWSHQPQMHFTLDERFLGGLLILVIAWVMEEGRELKEEHDLTI